MKVVINSCFGGFGMSDAAVERCIELGMVLTQYSDKISGYEDPTADFVLHDRIDEDDYCGRYNIIDDRSPCFRSDHRVIQAVEELGDKADGPYSKLKIIDIPLKNSDGWLVDEYHDGKERIVAIKGEWR